MKSPEATSDHFDLLPFISILMCVLGCLLLVTISMSAISIGAGAAESWTPQALGVEGKVAPPKEPILVEWDGKIATFQLPKRSVRGEWSEASPKGNPAFQGALKTAVLRKDRSYLMVAARPSGFATLLPLLDVLRESGLEVGYEPVEQARAVTLASAKPETAKSATAKPTTQKPATDESATEEPATGKSATEKPATEESATEKPDTKKPSPEEPATKKPGVPKSAIPKPSAEKP